MHEQWGEKKNPGWVKPVKINFFYNPVIQLKKMRTLICKVKMSAKGREPRKGTVGNIEGELVGETKSEKFLMVSENIE